MQRCIPWRGTLAIMAMVSMGGIVFGLFHGMFMKNDSPAYAAVETPGSFEGVFIPVVARNYPLAELFGLEMYQMTPEMGLEQALDSGAKWIRRNAMLWSQAEPKRGDYFWGSQPALQQELIDASNSGVEVILIVRSAPDWAREINTKDCSRIKPDALSAFGDFLYQAVKRYSAPPYNVKYWQIWNEPDVLPSVAVEGGINGCWGDPNDPYYGGGYYADVLRAVYPRIKEANPEVQVVVGGLLMDCNPNVANCSDYRQHLYLEGILHHNGAKDGGNYFDVVAFHAYDYYYGSLGRYGNSNWGSGWNETGPVVIAKTHFVRDLLASYNIGNKPIMATEAALICGDYASDPRCWTSDFEQTKAYFVPQLYAAALSEGLQANIWYHLLGWRGSGLLDANLNPLPAYSSYAFAVKELSGASYSRKITDYSSIFGYEFNRSNLRIWLVWSADGQPREITLPSKPVAIWDVFGNHVPLQGTRLEVGIQPLYVEIALH